ncbi:hypothetical protein C8J56DRAFT_1158554 [Mycena floridula]|nr:hypothetical protein C8J56DRAFT_1158554 [Mycena floridula]
MWGVESRITPPLDSTSTLRDAEPGTTAPLPSKSAKILREHLLRSQNSSLSWLSSSKYPARKDERKAAKLISLVGACSERWKDAKVFLSSNRRTVDLLFTQVHYPALPSLIVASSLRELHLTATSPIGWFPQWEQLQRISFSSPTIDELRDLQRSQQLQHLGIFETYDSLRPRRPELKFDHIRVLECSPSHLADFLEVPALEELRLGDSTNLILVQSFIRPLSSPLIAFTPACNADDDADAIIDLLNMLSELQTLKLCRILIW